MGLIDWFRRRRTKGHVASSEGNSSEATGRADQQLRMPPVPPVREPVEPRDAEVGDTDLSAADTPRPDSPEPRDPRSS